MNNSKSLVLFTVVLSLVVSIASIYVYDRFFSGDEEWKQEQIKKAYAVAENNVQFSDRFHQSYMSSVPSDFVMAANIAIKAVVFIKSDAREVNNSLPNINNQLNSGSGVVLSKDGYIATNFHVISGAKSIEIMLNDNRVFTAKVMGTDPNTDLALLKIEAENLEYLVFGNSDSLQIGEWVMAVGNPFKLQSTVTAGIVSAKARNINLLENQGIESFIQTDAAVNPGNSGGALINTRGDLVGICAAILSNSGRYEGFSFAVPSNLAKKVISDLKEFGVVQRGWLGIEIENIDNDLASKLGLKEVSGVYISSVSKNGGASDAGMQSEDVVITVNNVKTTNTSEFMEQIARYRPGNVLDIVYVRDGKLQLAKTTLKNQLNSTDFVAVRDDAILKELGVELREMDAYEKAILTPTGIMVVSVKNGSIIGETRMEPGYIITKINNKEVSSVSGLISLLDTYKGKTVILEGLYQKYPGEYPYTFMMPN